MLWLPRPYAIAFSNQSGMEMPVRCIHRLHLNAMNCFSSEGGFSGDSWRSPRNWSYVRFPYAPPLGPYLVVGFRHLWSVNRSAEQTHSTLVLLVVEDSFRRRNSFSGTNSSPLCISHNLSITLNMDGASPTSLSSELSTRLCILCTSSFDPFRKFGRLYRGVVCFRD
jgi:hypothetical protein